MECGNSWITANFVVRLEGTRKPTGKALAPWVKTYRLECLRGDYDNEDIICASKTKEKTQGEWTLRPDFVMWMCETANSPFLAQLGRRPRRCKEQLKM